MPAEARKLGVRKKVVEATVDLPAKSYVEAALALECGHVQQRMLRAYKCHGYAVKFPDYAYCETCGG